MANSQQQHVDTGGISRSRVTGVSGLGAATLDHFVNGPDHRAEEPLEGNKQNAKLSYSLAGPFNRKVCPFESSAVDEARGHENVAEQYSAPRILSPEASPRGGDPLSPESGTCRRLKRRFMKMTPTAAITPSDRPDLINGLTGPSKSLSQLQQRIGKQQHYEKENEHHFMASNDKGMGMRMKSACPSGPIDEKPSLRPAGVRKVVEGPSGAHYRGFSRGPNHLASRGDGGAFDGNMLNAPHRSESHGSLVFAGRRVDSQNSINTVQSQPSPGSRPTRKDNISTRSWRKGQELILRELGPNKTPSLPDNRTASKDAVMEDEEFLGNANNSNDDGVGQINEEPTHNSEVTPVKKRKPAPPKSFATNSAVEEATPSKPKVRHYNVSEIRAYLRKQQEMRKRKRQEEEAANEAKVERVRRQIAELREQQLAAIKKRKVRVPPPPVAPDKTSESARPHLNKTYTIDVEDDMEEDEDENRYDGMDHEHVYDLPMTLEDLEIPCNDNGQSMGYQPPREKYHEVWPSRVSADQSDVSPANHFPVSPRAGDSCPDPPTQVASRLTALEESASLLQSRLWQLAQRFGGSAGVVDEHHREPVAFHSQPVPYRSEPVIDDDGASSDDPPPFLSRYDRLTWESRKAPNPLEEETYLPGNTAVPEHSYLPYQFAASFLEDSTSEVSEEPAMPTASSRQESRPPLLKQDSAAKRTVPLFKSHPAAGDQRSKVQPKEAKKSQSVRRVDTAASLARDPYSFMRTYKKQRHLHKPHGRRAMDYHSDATASDDQNTATDGRSTVTDSGTTSEGASAASDGEDMYSDDFSPEQSREHIDSSRARPHSKAQYEEPDEVEYEDDFTSIAAPQSTSQRSGSFSHSTVVPSTGRSLARPLNSSEEVLESEYQRTSYEDPSESRRVREEAKDRVEDLPRPRANLRIPLPPSSSAVQDAPPLLSPGSLERRLFAELHYLESIEESVRQLGDIEKVRAVSMSQQETVSLAQILKARQMAHNQELHESQLNAQRNQLNAMTQLEETQQRFARAAEVATRSIDQVRNESSLLIHDSARRIMETHQHATEAAVQAAQQLAQARLAMSAKALPLNQNDAAQQVTLSQSTPAPVRCESPTAGSSTWRGSGRSSDAKQRATDADESWLKDEPASAADTDVDDSTLRTDTLDDGGHGSGSSIDEDILDRSFRMLLPSEEHRRRGRRSKESVPQNKATGDGHDTAGDESNTPSFRRFTDDMVRQYMREEELRAQHQITLLKLRKTALGEKMHTELEFLETQKRQLLKQTQGQSRRQQGPYNQLVEKQAALVRRWKQEEGEIDQLLEAQELADRRRRIMLEQDVHISKLKTEAKKIRDQTGENGKDHRPGERAKRYDKNSLSDWEQRLQQRRQRAEELIRWQEKLKNEEHAVKKLEREAIKIWNGSSKRPDGDRSGSETSTSTEPQRVSQNASHSSGSRPSRSGSSGKKHTSQSEATADNTDFDSEAPPRLRIGKNGSTSSISEDVSTEEPSTTSQESVVRSNRHVKRSDDESSIQEELMDTRADSRHASSNDSIPEAVAPASLTATASIRTEPLAGATTASISESVHGDATSRSARTRSHSPPSQSYGNETFESTSNTTTRLKRRLGDSVVTSLTSPRGPPRPAESKAAGGHHHHPRGGLSEDEDSYSCATTTISEGTEVSDMEGRLHALKEDLKHRVKTLNRLKREKARVNRERLKQKEESLHKHIEMYDKYITDLKAELDQDIRDASMLDSSMVTPVKPQIKAPRATTRDRSRHPSTDDKTAPSASQEGIADAESKKEEEEEDTYSMNFTTTAASEPSKKSMKYDEDETSSTQSEPSRKQSVDEDSHQEKSSSITEALSKSVDSTTAKSSKSALLPPSLNLREPSYQSQANDRSAPKSPGESMSVGDISTEISKHLRSQSSSSSHLSSRREQTYSDTSFKQSAKDSPRQMSGESPSEVSEQLSEQPSYSSISRSAETNGRSRSYSSKDKEKSRHSSEENAESVDSISEFLPSSVDTKQESAASAPLGQAGPAGDAGEAVESENVTPRTPRRLTFSEINEEYSASEQDTKSKDSDDSDGPVLKPLPTLDLRPVSPEANRSKSPVPQPPQSPRPELPDDVPDERIPLSARTIHSQMSDIPEDLPLSEHAPSEKTEDDYSYSEEFSAASSSRPASRSHVSESASRSRSSSTSSTSTITPSVGPSASSAAEEPQARPVPEEEEEQPREVKQKATRSTEEVARIVEEIFRETLRESLSVGLAASPATRKKEESAPEEEEEEDKVEVRAPAVVELDREVTAQLADLRDEEKKSPKTSRDGSPILMRTASFELTAEDELAEEVDRALAKRRMKRRLSNGSDDLASPPASPVSSLIVPTDQDLASPKVTTDTSFNDSILTSTPATTVARAQVSAQPTPDVPDVPDKDSSEKLLSTFAPAPGAPEEKAAKAVPPPSPIPSSEPTSRATTPPVTASEPPPRVEEDHSNFVVPHSRRHLHQMVSQAVSDLWSYVSGPEPPRLDRMPSQPSFDFCLVGEADEVASPAFATMPEDVLIRSRRAYKHMVYSLIRDTVRRIYAEEAPLRPWMCARPTRYRLWKDTKPPATPEKLLSIVKEEIETHMGFSASKKRESKLTQWSRKKRAGLGSSAAVSVDPVDDLLKSELRTEEADWVNYETEEVQVKLQVAEGLLMDLIEDTVQTVHELRSSSNTEAPAISSIPTHVMRELQSGWLDDSNPSLLL